MKTYYFDWCPRPTGSVCSRVQSGTLSVEDLNKDAHIKAAISSVVFHCRNDGVTLFSIEWSDKKFEKLSGLRISIAHTVSHLIKTKAGHKHVYNRKMHDYPFEHQFPTISVDPVELSKENQINESNLGDIIKSDQKMSVLVADSFKRKGEKLFAILLLRNQYAKLFEKSRGVREVIYNKQFSIWKLFSFVLLISFIYSLLQAWTDVTESQISITIQVSDFLEFVSRFWNVFSFAMMAFLFFVFVQEISIKRRKILKALNRARGYLLYGCIYDSIIQEIMNNSNSASKKKFERPVTSYETAIEIIDDHIALEKRKRYQAISYIVPLIYIFYERALLFAGVYIDQWVPEDIRSKIADLLIRN